MGTRYNKSTDNRAYVDGYLRGRQADGLDWVKARMAVYDAIDLARKMLAEKDREIARLKLEIADKDMQIIDLESQIEAHRIAWKHRNEA